MKHFSHQNIHSRALGFSMLEILITLVIVATALLGTAGLQAYAMRMGQGGQLRNQAIFLASDIAERIEVNSVGAVAGNYTLAATSSVSAQPGTLCSATACDATALATWDIYEWETALTNALPQVTDWSITAPTCVGGAPLPSLCNYTVTIAWSDRRSNTTYAAYNAASSVGINTAGNGERFSFTTTRTVVN